MVKVLYQCLVVCSSYRDLKTTEHKFPVSFLWCVEASSTIWGWVLFWIYVHLNESLEFFERPKQTMSGLIGGESVICLVLTCTRGCCWTRAIQKKSLCIKQNLMKETWSQEVITWTLALGIWEWSEMSQRWTHLSAIYGEDGNRKHSIQLQ